MRRVSALAPPVAPRWRSSFDRPARGAGDGWVRVDVEAQGARLLPERAWNGKRVARLMTVAGIEGIPAAGVARNAPGWPPAMWPRTSRAELRR
jgi:hypothetical protein